MGTYRQPVGIACRKDFTECCGRVSEKFKWLPDCISRVFTVGERERRDTHSHRQMVRLHLADDRGDCRCTFERASEMVSEP